MFTRRILLGAFTGALLSIAAPAAAQTIEDYSALPPFVASPVTPNVLLIMDNSGSMRQPAYRPSTEPYDPSVKYGGYFNSDLCYDGSTSNGFTVHVPISGAPKPCGATGHWDGNFLNWFTMSRLEVTKYVMMGGKCAPRVAGNCYPGGSLRFESDVSSSEAYFWQETIPAAVMAANTPITTSRCLRRDSTELRVRSGSSCSSGTFTDYPLRVEAFGAEPNGVIQQIGTRARFGLMEFTSSNTANGGKVLSVVGGNTTSMVNAIENTIASTWTPLAESLYEASRYFAQVPPAYANSDYQTNTSNDPYYFQQPDWIPSSQYVPCCKSFVILFTDGQPTKDQNIPSAIRNYAVTALNQSSTGHLDVCSSYYGGSSSDPCVSDGSHYLDDVALWAHTNDLRASTLPVIGGSGKDLPGMQNLTVYTFFAFGSGARILQDAAKAGGFDDINGDGVPGPSSLEWDRNGDGVPDTYFESSDAFAMRERLMAAITDILARSASGTSVSVLATSSGGEGAVYQAYFYPALFDEGREVSWLGFLQGIFIDDQGRLREDTDEDGRLVLTRDRVIQTFFDPLANETRVRRWAVDSSTGEPTGSPETIGLRDLLPIWEAGRELAERDLATSPRTIKTWVDLDGDGVVDDGEFIDFDTANESTLRRYLRAANSTEGTNIIEFIQGSAVTGYRSRQITVRGTKRTWRLGDIIYSSPVSVGAPAERFDLRYRDQSYQAFFEKYKNRRNVVYVGANDGMLHAFNGGFFKKGDDPSTTDREQVWFATTPTGTGSGTPLGAELWAFIPQELLPHLKWLTGENYDKTKHVYYVDGTPRIVDAKIFTEESACTTSGLDSAGCIHPGGWGTVLIGSMRLGGGLIRADLDGDGSTSDPGEDRFRSAYFALDITDPDNADASKRVRLLWVYWDGDLGFSTSWPGIVRSDDTTWYLVFGSGPLSYTGERIASATGPTGNKFTSGASEYGQVYVVDLATGTLVRKMQTDTADRYAFMGDPVVYDLPRDYVPDVIYIGKAFGTAGSRSGKLYRLLPRAADFSSVELTALFDPGEPVLVKPTASMDRNNRLWIYGGTGRYFTSGSSGDAADSTAQMLFGLKESETSQHGCWNLTGWLASCPAAPIPVSTLVDVTGASVEEGGALTCGTCGGAATVGDLVAGVINGGSPPKQGWYIKLTGGERVLQESTVIGGLVLATTFTPNTDVCSPQGTNALYSMYYQSGTAFTSSTIGLDGTTVRRKIALGQGIASKVNVVVSEGTVTGLVQSSTGEIIQVQGIGLTSNIRSGVRAWREMSD
ncbi:MAG TPA: PilC/PilY family type IV pilus protein [Thermodesulfobacteriota bacterium]